MYKTVNCRLMQVSAPNENDGSFPFPLQNLQRSLPILFGNFRQAPSTFQTQDLISSSKAQL